MRRLRSLCRQLNYNGLMVVVLSGGRGDYRVRTLRYSNRSISCDFTRVSDCEHFLLSLFR